MVKSKNEKVVYLIVMNVFTVETKSEKTDSKVTKRSLAVLDAECKNRYSD